MSLSNYTEPTTRPLTVYAFDPTLGRKLNNYMTMAIPYERLERGPIGEKIAVIDYDASNGLYYEPVDLDHPAVTLRGGLEPTESDPRFHQQMVYAVASDTLRRFEFALGRKIKWRTRPGSRLGKDPFHSKLRIFPHAFQQANAFYDPDLRALCFGYFSASADDPGDNIPGQTIFTCLSHDIVAHETTHAIVDSLRRYFSKPGHIDTPAFHEAFADIVALFQHFSQTEALLETIYRTGGVIYRSQLQPDVKADQGKVVAMPELTEDNPLVGLARQFGEAMGMRSALRSAIGTPPKSNQLESVTEPHLRGSILVAAVFDAYFTIYIKRTRDLMRIGRVSGAVTASDDLHPDLANRLAREAAKTAGHFVNICIRALDYCPPVDLTFGEFLRAIITADSDLVPDDPWGYRAEIIKAFRLRGIIPESVSSFSEESLRWCSPEVTHHSIPPCRGLRYDVIEREETDKEQLADKAVSNAVILTNYAKANAAGLGLTYTAGQLPKIAAHSFHPIYRIGPNGRLVVEFVVEFLQQMDVPLDPLDKSSPQFTFRGGSTVIFDSVGNARYSIEKGIDSAERLAAQREFYSQSAFSMAISPYNKKQILEPLNFAAIHRGY